MQSRLNRPDWLDRESGTAVRLKTLWSFMGWPHKTPRGVEVPGSDMRCPEWPPDVFALCAAALRKSGAYTVDTHHLLGTVKPEIIEAGRRHWLNQINDAGENGQISRVPEEVEYHWRVVTTDEAQNCLLSRLADNRDHAISLLVLMALADETCRGIGLPKSGRHSHLHTCADHLLFPTQFGSTLCRYIHPSAGRVLPKMHTAQCGLTIRSFSHHLAFCETDEVQPSWLSVPGARGDVRNVHHFNILIAPWPEVVVPGQIHPRSPRPTSPRTYDRFDFGIVPTELKAAVRLEAMAKAAQDITGSLDAVVMPELALGSADYRACRTAMLQNGWLFICGVGTARNENRLTFDVPLSKHHAVHLRQRKHHRWKLDEAQIRTYGLGARLDPSRTYWENIAVHDRKLMFVVLRPWLVTTALICEDLARHDPVGELIRGIGPNLVIALLMDGPQITGRWASRYAAGLADDPGSSVLSVTSLGMAELSRPLDSDKPASRVVALWKDAYSGKPVELTVPPGYQGLVITLAVARGAETTADLRSDSYNASYPRLAGVHPVKVPDSSADLTLEPPNTRWISPWNAFLLSQLAQTTDLSPTVPPRELEEIRDPEARGIGHEIWRLKTRTDKVRGDSAAAKAVRDWHKFQIATEEQAETANQIYQWDKTNVTAGKAAGAGAE